MTPHTHLVGVIGDPVAHSRSPAMHNAAFAHLGIDAHYERWHTPAAELPARMQSLRDPSIWGASVTLPHKAAVIPFLDELEPLAARIGAVNTIYKRHDGALMGANTDAPGLIDDIREAGGFEPAGQRVVLLGASGAARAAAYALLDAGVASLVVANRTRERADRLCNDIASTLSDTSQELLAMALDDTRLPEYIAASHLVINATSLGWKTDETPFPNLPVSSGTLVYDMVYRHTRLLHDAAQRGARVLDGMGMLVRQGALAFVRWTGHKPPVDIMFDAVKQAL